MLWFTMAKQNGWYEAFGAWCGWCVGCERRLLTVPRSRSGKSPREGRLCARCVRDRRVFGVQVRLGRRRVRRYAARELDDHRRVTLAVRDGGDVVELDHAARWRLRWCRPAGRVRAWSRGAKKSR